MQLPALYCVVLYIAACVDVSRMVFRDYSWSFSGPPTPLKAEICLEKLAVNALVKFTKGNVTAPLSNK